MIVAAGIYLSRLERRRAKEKLAALDAAKETT